MNISNNEIPIKVGIKTDGHPVLRYEGDVTIVENMLIGDGFHWQKSISTRLPGKVIEYEPDGHSGNISSDDNVTLINILPLEKYLECVVGSEMNPNAPLDFLKAHAVISRSWALGKILAVHNTDKSDQRNEKNLIVGWDDNSNHHGFDVCSDDHCQRYQGIQELSQPALEAIGQTEGQVLISPEGKLVDTRFSKCCGGVTEIFSTCWQSAKESCLESIPDPWCDLSGMNPVARRAFLSSVMKDYDIATDCAGFSWESEITKSEIRNNLIKHFNRDIGDIKKIEPIHRGPSGRIDLLRIHGDDGYLDLGKELWIRRLLSSSHLYSSRITIEDKGNTFGFKGKGWGHGVGLCQIGAANMAANGYSYSEILSFYYPGSILGSWKQALLSQSLGKK